jgi:hypothetical protein
MLATKERSIFNMSMGSCSRWEKDEKPVPTVIASHVSEGGATKHDVEWTLQ